MKRAIVFLLVMTSFYSYSQNNLLDTSSWTVGSSSVPDFIDLGASGENLRELGTTPFGSQATLWKASPDGVTSGYDGGWFTSIIPIDNLKTYRFSVWMKKSNSFDGVAVLTAKVYDSSSNSAGLRLNGNSVSNATFEGSDVSELDKWYLYIGFIHEANYIGTSSIGGVYNQMGNKILDSQDFKFSPVATGIRHRVYLHSSGNTDDNLYFYDPTIYEVNGQEPTITTLLNPNSDDTQAPTAPNVISIGETDTTASLSWSGATDNVGVTGYRIFKDGVLEITLGNVTSYQVTGLTAATSYGFTAISLDAAGNESPSSNTVPVTTNSSGGSSSGSTVWNESSGDISYTNGNVGIGTSALSTYKLAVDGNIRTREVKVDNDTWPDYVFLKDYQLPTLKEVQKHITEKGHLINIPSAEEVEANGIELGEMNKLLLEKIEELTLYILKQEKTNKKQQNQIDSLLKNEYDKIK